MNALDTLRAAVAAAGWSEGDMALAENVAADLMALQARQLTGEDVSEEMEHVRAQLVSLGATAANDGARVFASWVQRWAAALVSYLLRGV